MRKTLRIKEANHWKNGILPPKDKIKNITGTFIYQIPVDYIGVPSLEWKTREWVSEFQRLKNLGFDTVINHAAICKITPRDWYVLYDIPKESLQAFNDVRKRRNTAPIIKPCLNHVVEAAEKTGMNLHLGLFAVIDEWYTNNTPEFLNSTSKQEIITAQDLINLYGDYECLKGWYIPQEISWIYHGRLKRFAISNFLRPICKFLKAETPNKLIGISPMTHSFRLLEGKIYNFWIDALRNTGIDVLYPQDVVGALLETPARIRKTWALWKKIADFLGMELWANCDTWERNTFKPSSVNLLYSAPYRRLLWQLESVSPFSDKIVTWEAMYFINPDGAIGGKKLHDYYRDYFNFSK